MLRRVLIALASTLALVGGITVVTGSPALAATCSRTGCSGKSPTASGCATGAKTLHTMTDGWLRVELRYSTKCHAAWARWTVVNHDLWYPSTVMIRRYNINNVQTAQYKVTTRLDIGNSGVTKMLGLPASTPSHFKACDQDECTAPG
jgi:hypothetical protein